MRQVSASGQAQAQAQLEDFRQRNIRAKAIVMEQEATLRNLLGLPPTDGEYLYAVEEPSKAPMTHDWPHLVETAISSRPDITRKRLAIRLEELYFLQARNALLPKVDLQGLWRVNGLGEDLPAGFALLGTSDSPAGPRALGPSRGLCGKRRAWCLRWQRASAVLAILPRPPSKEPCASTENPWTTA